MPGYPAGVSDSTAPQTRPARVTAAAVLTALEGTVIAAFGLGSLVMLFTGDPDGMTQALTMALTVLALAALPLLAARGLWLRRRWSRGPSMITQLLALPVGWQMAQNGGAWAAGGALIGAIALAVLVCVVNPTATEALGIGPRDA
ncbi:hypothetical protein D7M15_20615 [Streptomyces sp. Z26]|nr:hypothetical protein [Streptomyces sp. Z26]RLL70649.1 hypothetical protein D7M15_20615 [Streptomyces sp. Z26]